MAKIINGWNKLKDHLPLKWRHLTHFVFNILQRSMDYSLFTRGFIVKFKTAAKRLPWGISWRQNFPFLFLTIIFDPVFKFIWGNYRFSADVININFPRLSIAIQNKFKEGQCNLIYFLHLSFHPATSLNPAVFLALYRRALSINCFRDNVLTFCEKRRKSNQFIIHSVLQFTTASQ